ncbi:putative orfan [Tupanvirus soda lake]|uniref:Orfan n=2 Tax=Tupanvirus TaxID=2094720 RepID=A0AC62AAE9_9VIRU|nr:putative orfan [Tupanvirus soda lake]QKU34684.1 putative orfan [Tupanvirus soda lake]
MNGHLEICVMFNCNLENTSPMVLTTFTPTDTKNHDSFEKAKHDINNSNCLTKKQIEHFNKYIDFLSQSTYPLVKYETIHIFSSSCEGITHYVQFDNTLLNKNVTEESNTVIETKNRSLYMNYRPEIFENKWMRFVTYGAQYLPVNYNSVSSGRNTNVSINIGGKMDNIKGKNRLSIFFNGLTILNCFTYAALYSIHKHPNLLNTLIQHPFRNSWSVIFDGIVYSAVGSFISGISPYYSNLIFNGIMCYINYAMYKMVGPKILKL